MSTTVYTTNFDSATAGSNAPGWVAASGTWAVGTRTPHTGTQSLQSNTNANGDTNTYQGIAAAADQGIRFVQTMPSSPAQFTSAAMPFLRSDAGNTQGYTFIWDTTTASGSGNAWSLFKRVSSANSQVGAAQNITGYSPAPGDVFWTDAYCLGSTIAVKFWKDGTAEPTSYYTFTDTSVTTAGFCGVRLGLSGSNTPLCMLDDVTIYTGPPFAVAAPINIPVTDANLVFSPQNWDYILPASFTTGALASGTAKQATSEGAYVRAAFASTTSIGINVDVSTLTAASIAAGSYPQISYSVNNSPRVDRQLTSADATIALGSGLTSSATNDVRVWLKGVDQSIDRWGAANTSPVGVLRVTGFSVDAGATTAPYPYALTQTAVLFSDSIGAGKYILAAPGSTTEPGVQDGVSGMGALICRALNAEHGIIAYESQGFEQTGSGNVASLQTASGWQSYSSGRSRLVGGLFSPMPTYVLCMHGYNGTTTTSDVSNWLTAVRAATTANVWIFVLIPIGGVISGSRATLISGVSAYQAANPSDARVALIDIQNTYGTGPLRSFNTASAGTSVFDSVDSVHPYGPAAARIAPLYASLIQNVLAPAASASANATATVAAMKTDTKIARMIAYGADNHTVTVSGNNRVVTFNDPVTAALDVTHTVGVDPSTGATTGRTLS